MRAPAPPEPPAAAAALPLPLRRRDPVVPLAALCESDERLDLEDAVVPPDVLRLSAMAARKLSKYGEQRSCEHHAVWARQRHPKTNYRKITGLNRKINTLKYRLTQTDADNGMCTAHGRAEVTLIFQVPQRRAMQTTVGLLAGVLRKAYP